jgi:hypothetical protein
MTDHSIIDWLLEGDVAIQYQVHRDLLHCDKRRLQDRIAREGWGARFLSFRHDNGHWGGGFYQSKWISTHYTLLDLKNLSIAPRQKDIRSTIQKILREQKGSEGGINPSRGSTKSEVCVSGMFLNYASYFGADEDGLRSVVDFILSLHMADGGFNCRLNYSGATHSSLHTTLSVMEGIHEYACNGYTYRLAELKKAEEASRQFILLHRLFRSHRTGEIIDKKFLMLSHPSRWRYDILRALDYFYFSRVKLDERMTDAIDVLLKKQRPDMKWPLQAKHSGQTHFDMERTGEVSRWNTLRALRVLEHFGVRYFC